MQIPLLHQQILLQTERLRDLHRSIMSHTTAIPAEELDTLLQEIRNLYSLALQLNNENAIQLLNEIKLAAKEIIVKEAASSIQTIEIPEPTIIQKELEKIAEVKQTALKSEEKPAEKKRIVTDIHEMYQVSPSLANKFSDHKTVGEKIAGNESTRRISDHLKTSVTDLKSAIGLNEKFQFINHLFKGDSKKYHLVIDQLNASPNSETAMSYLKEISDTNDWESHAAAAKTFIDIIERRFTA